MSDNRSTGIVNRILPAGLVLVGLYLVSRYGYLLFHSLAELFAVVVACGIFIIAWNTRRLTDTPFFLFIGIAYLFVGGIDLLHMLAYSGMNVFSGYDANLPTQLWIVARYTESLSLLMALLFFDRKIKSGFVVFCYIFILSLLGGLIFYWKTFPACFVEGVGLTSFKIGSEYVICLLFLSSIGLLWQRRKALDGKILQWLIAALLVSIGTELSFTLYQDPYGFYNLVGHFLKVVSFYLVYVAVIETNLIDPYSLLLRTVNQREKEVREAHILLEKTFASLEDAVLVVDPNTRATLACNLAVERILGYTREEIVGNNTEFLHVNRAMYEEFGRRIFAALDTHGVYQDEFQMRRKDGILFPTEHTVTEIRNESGNRTSVVSVVRDITERKRMEQTLIRSERLLVSSELSAGICHNLNNILTSILGPAMLLKRKARDPQLLQDVEMIISSSKRAADLVKKLHVSVRGQTGEPYCVNLNEAIEQTIRLTQSRWEEQPAAQGIDIDLRAELGGVPPIRGTEPDVQTMIANLIFNAVEAMPEGGQIRLQTRIEDDYVRFSFRDTGIGMEEELRRRVFEPLFTTKMDIGSGLGLSSLHGTLTQWGGKVEVESAPGEGTTFTLYFPVWTEPDEMGEEE